jgi:pimeloyl-ACP methyl ester carboxylesterase
MAAPRRDPYEMDVHWVEVDGRPVRSLTLAAGAVGHDGPQVVFMPGLGAPGYLVPWARRASRWADTALLDLPGWSRGRARSCPPTLTAVAGATAGWLEMTDRRGVILVGHSTGAQAVLRAAHQALRRVAGVVLAGPSFEPAARSWPAVARRALALPGREPAGAAQVAAPSYLRSGGIQLARFIGSALHDVPEQQLRDLQVPVLVLAAARDPFCPPAWARHLAAIAGAPCHVLDGAHMTFYSHPDVADNLVRRATDRWPTLTTPHATDRRVTR